jgi:hypothetical protein
MLAAVQQADALQTLLLDSTTVRVQQTSSGARKKRAASPGPKLITVVSPGSNGLFIHSQAGSFEQLNPPRHQRLPSGPAALF